MNELSYEQVASLVRLEAETGRIYWLSRTPDMFSSIKNRSESSCRAWNTKYAGKEDLKSPHSDGYRHGSLYNRKYAAHRIVWLLHYKTWPTGQIDHINGVPDDNRLENLRDVSNAENGKNRKTPANNSSGVQGVYWDRRENRWCAQIKYCGRKRLLGRFKAFNDAVGARKAAETALGFHENHGRHLDPGSSSQSSSDDHPISSRNHGGGNDSRHRATERV